MMQRHPKAGCKRYKTSDKSVQTTEAGHDRKDPVASPQIPDEPAGPGNEKALPQCKRAQRPPFGIAQLAFAAASPQERVEQRNHGHPAQEVEGDFGENKDLESAGEHRQDPSARWDVAHRLRF